MNKETLEFNTIEKVCLKSGAVILESNEFMSSFHLVVVNEGSGKCTFGDLEKHIIGHKIEQQLFDLILSLGVQCSITQKECNILGEGFYVGKGKDRLDAIFEFLNDNWYVMSKGHYVLSQDFENIVKTILKEGL